MPLESSSIGQWFPKERDPLRKLSEMREGSFCCHRNGGQSWPLGTSARDANCVPPTEAMPHERQSHTEESSPGQPGLKMSSG